MSDLVFTKDNGTPTPPTGTASIYAKSDGLFYTKDEFGNETPLKGATGATGPQGATGPGVASGGTTGQYLKKNSGTSYDTTWGGIQAADVPTLNQNTTGTASGFTGSLSGDVTGTQSATVVSSVGGSTAANVHTAEVAVNTNATSSATASTLMKRDSNANVAINNFNEAFVTTAAAAGTTTLTVSSAPLQQFTGTTTQTVKLPAANTLPTGAQYYIFNRSTGAVTVQDNSGGAVQVIAGGGQCCFTCAANGTAAGTWDTTYTYTGTLPISLGGTGQTTQQAAIDSLTGTQSSGKYLRSDGTHATLSSIQAADVPTLNQNTTGTSANVTGTVAIANGGTGQTTASAAFNALSPMTTLGDVVYGGTSGAGTRLAGSTSSTKQFLTQTGTGTASAAPAWGTIAAADVPTLNQNTTGTASNVTGTVAIGNGGTGQTTASAAFGALSPLTTKGDLLVYGTANTRLGVGSDAQVLTADSTQASGVKWAGLPSSSLTVATKTAAYTILPTDQLILANANTAAFTLTLPAASSNSGKILYIKKTDSTFNAVTISRAGSDTVCGKTSVTLNTVGETVTLVSDGTSNWTPIAHSMDTDWQSYTPTVSTGTWTNTNGWWRREGDMMKVKIYAGPLTANGTATTLYTWTLPSGPTMDVSGNKGPSTTPSIAVTDGASNTYGPPLGIASVNNQGGTWYMDGATGSNPDGRVFATDSTHVCVVLGSSATANRAHALGSDLGLASVTGTVQLNFEVPISNWSTFSP